MKSKSKGVTKAEKYFINKVEDGTLLLNEEGMVFNSKTNRYIGATGSGRYPKISMKDTKNKTIYHVQIHRLIWLVFMGDIPNGYEINHKDLNQENRNLINLELVTKKQNMQHFINSDKFIHKPGEMNPNSKLKDKDVLLMREEYKSGKFRMEYYCNLYGVHPLTIQGALDRKTYSHI